MKKSLLIAIMLMSALTSLFSQNHNHSHDGKIYKSIPNEEGIIRCHTMEIDSINRSLNPNSLTLEQEEEWLQKKIAEHKDKYGDTKGQKLPVLIIPVVVHVIHNGDAVGSGENIADGQVISQITVLNEDYRRLLGSNGYNTNPVGADVEIEFCFAQVDPLGNPTNGIDRVNTGVNSYNTNASVETMKTTTIWDPTQYLNMWTVRFGGGMSSILGYAQFPSSSGLAGMPGSGGSANTDGVVAAYNAFGSVQKFPTGSYMSTYNLGRTMTHEVGHWLGLIHTWGDGGCSVDDFCADTPICSNDFYSNPPGCGKPTQCDNVRQIENYMDYSGDGCMNIFTQDQKLRIRAVMLNSPRRNTLPTSLACNAPPCEATSTHTCDPGEEYVQRVQLGTINNATGCSNYTNYSSIATTLTKGLSYDVTVTPRIVGDDVGSVYNNDEIAVWIDWNGNGDFTDAGEEVGYELISSTGAQTFNFTVPLTANLGPLRMRVRLSYQPVDGTISPCGTTLSGETEDYVVNIQNPMDANFEANSTSITLGQTVNFTDLTTNNPNTWTWVISGAGWNFTGGTNATSQNPQVQFNDAGTYTINLTAANASENDTEIKTDYITVIDDVGIDKNILDKISIYPNPTNGTLFVNLSELGIQVTQIILKDVTGRDITVKTLPNGLVEFDLSYQATGIYFITIQTENNTITKKIIRM